MMPAVNHARTIAQLCELLSDSVSLKAMALPTMVSVALTRGIARRVFLPTTAEKCPSLENHPTCALPLSHALKPPHFSACNKHSIRAGRGHCITQMQYSLPRFLY